MRSETVGKTIILYPEGRVDSSNAQEIQREIDALLSGAEEYEPVIDAGKLEYISSAGLRVLMALAKKQPKPLLVQNVLPAVYEIFDMTGFTEIMNVKKKMREVSVDGCEIIGHGAIGTVYRLDPDTIVKVYEIPDAIPMIENEQKRAKQAFLKGIPTAISYDVVKVGDKYGSVFELLKAATYNELLVREPERLDEIMQKYTALMKQLHAVTVNPGELPKAVNVFLDYLKNLTTVLPDDLYQKLYALFSAMPENLHMIHGDLQLKNIMSDGGDPLLIDMDTLSTGDPVFDLMGVYLTYILFIEDDPADAMEFHGMTDAFCKDIWEKTSRYYFDTCSPEAIRHAERKIRIVAIVRMLYLICVLKIGKPQIKQIRIEHAITYLRETIDLVDSLEVGNRNAATGGGDL